MARWPPQPVTRRWFGRCSRSPSSWRATWYVCQVAVNPVLVEWTFCWLGWPLLVTVPRQCLGSPIGDNGTKWENLCVDATSCQSVVALHIHENNCTIIQMWQGWAIVEWFYQGAAVISFICDLHMVVHSCHLMYMICDHYPKQIWHRKFHCIHCFVKKKNKNWSWVKSLNISSGNWSCVKSLKYIT